MLSFLHFCFVHLIFLILGVTAVSLECYDLLVALETTTLDGCLCFSFVSDCKKDLCPNNTQNTAALSETPIKSIKKDCILF